MKRKIFYLLISIMVIFILLGSLNVIAAEKIVIYVSLAEEDARQAISAFEKETGIEVEWVRLSGGECVARLDAEKGNPQASMWYGGVGLDHIAAKERGLTIAYESPNASAIPDKFKGKEHYWTGIYANPLCFGSNMNRLKELGLDPPTSWADLIKPEYKGNIQVANPGTSGTSYNVLATMVQLMGEEKAFEYMKGLHQNIFQYTKSGSKPLRNTAIGEIPIGIGYAGIGLRLVDEGYPVRITFPSEGTGYEIAAISLIKGGPQTELAKKLYDWALSEEAAKLYANWFVSPTRSGVKLKEGVIAISDVNTIAFDDVWAGKNKARLVEKWNEEVYK